MSRRKKPVVARTPAPSHPATPPWHKRAWGVVLSAWAKVRCGRWHWYTIVAIVGTILYNAPTFLQNIRQLPSEVEATSSQLIGWWKEDAAWEGDWSTFPEGIVNMADMHLSEGIDLKISLYSKNGKLDGMLATHAICNKFPVFDFLLLRGSASGKVANIEILDFVDGREVVFGTMKLMREGNVITVCPDKGSEWWLPSKVRIGKHPNNQPDESFMFNYCKRVKLRR